MDGWTATYIAPPFLLQPPTNQTNQLPTTQTQINARLSAVEELAFALPPCLERTSDALLRRHKRGGRARHALPDLESMVTTLHYRRLSPRRLLALLRTVEQALLALPSTAEAGAEVQSALLRAELGRVPAASLRREAGALLALVDPRAAEAEDKANLFVDPAFHPGLTERTRALGKVERGLEEELEAARVRLKRPQLQYRTLRTGGVLLLLGWWLGYCRFLSTKKTCPPHPPRSRSRPPPTHTSPNTTQNRRQLLPGIPDRAA